MKFIPHMNINKVNTATEFYTNLITETGVISKTKKGSTELLETLSFSADLLNVDDF